MTGVMFLIHALAVGGAEMILVDLANGLDGERFRRTVVAISDTNPLAVRLDPEAVTFVAAPRSWRYDPAPVRRIRRLLDAGDVGAVVCFDFYTYALYVAASAGRAGVSPRAFVSVHSSGSVTRKEKLQDAVYTRLLRRGDLVVGVCRNQVEILSRKYAIRRERFRVVHTGVDVDRYDPERVEAAPGAVRDELGIPATARVVLCVANLLPVKDLGNAITALSCLTGDGAAETWLVIVGRDPVRLRHQLQATAERLGVARRVVFAGPREDVRPLYSTADLFTLSSRSEAFSRAALEALSMGLPCVLTDVGGAREMIRENVNGYVVPAREPVALAMGWRRALEAGFESGRIRADVCDRFSLPACVRGYERLFAGAADAPAEGAA